MTVSRVKVGKWLKRRLLALRCLFLGHKLRLDGRELYSPEYVYPEYEEFVSCNRCKGEFDLNEPPETFWQRVKDIREYGF